MLSRIRSILDSKEKYSLEELAKLFSPDAVKAAVSNEQLASINEIDSRLIPLIISEYGKSEYDIFDIALLAAVSLTSAKPEVSEEDARSLIRKASSLVSKPYGQTYTAFSAEGIMYIALTKEADQIQFDSGIDIIDTQSLEELAGKLNIKYRALFE